MNRDVLSAGRAETVRGGPPVEPADGRSVPEDSAPFPARLLLAILDATNLATYLKDAQGRYLFVNRQYVDLAKAPREVILGRCDAELFPPDIAALFREQDAEVTRRRTLLEFEETIRLPDGVFSFITAKFPLLDERGCVYAVGGVCTDITNRARRFAESRAAERERLAATLRSAGDAIVSVDTEGIVLTLNRAAEALTGWSQAGAAGRPVGQVLLLHDTGGAPQAIPGEEGDEPVFPGAVLESRTGERREVSVTRSPVFDRVGARIGSVFVLHDETGRIRLERELFRAHHLEALGLLAGGIAHDFNNLFMSMLGNLNLARMHGNDPCHARTHIDASEKAIRRAQELTRQLHVFARGGDPVKSQVPLPDLIREAASFIVTGSRVSCRFELPADLRAVEADRSQIAQVVQNLVLNARQAMPGGGTVTVRARNVPEEADGVARVALEVEDEGPGVPEEIRARIFDPYFTTRGEGSGLGLAITHSIVARHGGTLSVGAAPAGGALFTVTLPAAVALPAA